jgi:hypothetical protein
LWAYPAAAIHTIGEVRSAGNANESDLDFSAIERLHQVHRAGGTHFDAHAGVELREPGEQGREQELRLVISASDAQRAAQVRRGDRFQRFVVQRQQSARIVEQPHAVLAQPLRAAHFLEQRHAELLLEPRHLLRDRRLRSVHLLGSEREALPIGDRDESAQKLQLERMHDS